MQRVRRSSTPAGHLRHASFICARCMGGEGDPDSTRGLGWHAAQIIVQSPGIRSIRPAPSISAAAAAYKRPTPAKTGP